MSARRVLVVDDNADIANLTALLLESHGCEVATALDGPSALAQAAAVWPDVVFLDLNLPGMDGFEIARRLRAQQGERPLKIVVLSGYVDQGTHDRAAESGVDAVMEKQGEVDALEESLRSFL